MKGDDGYDVLYNSELRRPQTPCYRNKLRGYKLVITIISSPTSKKDRKEMEKTEFIYKSHTYHPYPQN